MPSSNMEEDRTVVSRESQYLQLINIFQKSQVLPGAVMIWGPSSSGKSTVVERVIEDTKISNVATVHSREIICGKRELLGSIIQRLFKKYGVNEDNLNSDSLAEFVNQLCQLRTKINFGSEPFVVVIEEVETLLAEHGELIEMFSRLQDLVQFNVCVLFLSSLPLSSYLLLLYLKPMLTINFPQYSKEEIAAIILKEAPSTINAELYSFFVKMTLSVFYMACRDIRKLQRLAILNFDKFVTPISGEVSNLSQKMMHDLWKMVQPQLARDFKTLRANIIPYDSGDGQGSNSKSICCLPKYSKYLLVAAYLATYNPASSDRRFFVKAQLGKKRRKVVNQHKQKSLDSQTFPLARLLAIYRFLTDQEGPTDTIMLSQLTSLCTSNVLERVDHSVCPLDDPKYKCMVSYEFVEDIAKSLDIDLKKYMYNYV